MTFIFSLTPTIIRDLRANVLWRRKVTSDHISEHGNNWMTTLIYDQHTTEGIPKITKDNERNAQIIHFKKYLSA